jgi:hemolysin activation/secretion protein
VAVRPQLSRTQILPDNFVFYGSLSGQWANEPVLNLEELAVGGNGSVRGYREGEYYADTGFLEQAELRTPIYWRGINRRIGTQFFTFMDYGQGYQLDSSEAIPHEALWGAGAGVNFNLGPHVQSHILVGWPLLNTQYTGAGRERITFSLSAQL